MAKALRLEQSEKPASLGAGQYQGLIAPVRTTRLTGGSDFSMQSGVDSSVPVVVPYATSHLYFSTLYSGTNGTMIGTVLTYFWYSGSLP